jgi:hypothetical protein
MKSLKEVDLAAVVLGIAGSTFTAPKGRVAVVDPVTTIRVPKRAQ